MSGKVFDQRQCYKPLLDTLELGPPMAWERPAKSRTQAPSMATSKLASEVELFQNTN